MADPAAVFAALGAGPFEARSASSLWQQIANRIEAACRDGRLSGRLPGEHQMAEAFGVTRVTMRRALTRLQQEGLQQEELLQSRKGVGIFVRPVPLRDRVDHGKRFADGLDHAAQAGTQTLALSRSSATTEEAEGLQIERGRPVIRLSRIRLVHAARVYFKEMTFPAIFSGFEDSYAPRESVRDVYLAMASAITAVQKPGSAAAFPLWPRPRPCA